MNITINAVSAKRGGAVSYLENVLPELRRQAEAPSRIVVYRGAKIAADVAGTEGIEFRSEQAATGRKGAVGGTWQRLWFDQVQLPRMLRQERMDVLFSSANFGPLRCPCRQVLLARNAIYYDRVYLNRIRSFKVNLLYRFQRWLTRLSMASSDVVLFPSQAMFDLTAQWVGGARPNWHVAHFGIRQDAFYPHPDVDATPSGPIRLLNISFYSDQKNFGTLLQAVEQVEQMRPGLARLRLTAGFGQDWLGASPFFPNFRREQTLYRRLHERNLVEEVEWGSYGSMPALYRSADVFVFPSYLESFGHPLLEAMASGLPVVAADTPVNRELCGPAALYFPPFDVAACAETLVRIAEDPVLRAQLRAVGLERVKTFTWERHVGRLLEAFRAA